MNSSKESFMDARESFTDERSSLMFCKYPALLVSCQLDDKTPKRRNPHR